MQMRAGCPNWSVTRPQPLAPVPSGTGEGDGCVTLPRLNMTPPRNSTFGRLLKPYMPQTCLPANLTAASSRFASYHLCRCRLGQREQGRVFRSAHGHSGSGPGLVIVTNGT
jgi:hypothetical protein